MLVFLPIIHVRSSFTDFYSYHFLSNLFFLNLFLHFLLMFKFPSLPSSISFKAFCVGFVTISFSESFHFSFKAFPLLILFMKFKKILNFDALSKQSIYPYVILTYFKILDNNYSFCKLDFWHYFTVCKGFILIYSHFLFLIISWLEI